MTSLINGQSTDRIGIHDRGLGYGDGLFETIAIRDGRALLWTRHMQRLADGCARLDIDMPALAVLETEARHLSADAVRAVLRVTITRGPGRRGYRPQRAGPATRILTLSDWPDWPGRPAEWGVSLRWCRQTLARQPALAGIKHLNRLEQVLARAEWDDEHAEGLMCDTEGYVIEGTMSNLFVRRGASLITPELSQSGVAGVLRAEVLEATARIGIDCREDRLRPDDLRDAGEIFITNSLIGIWPVTDLAGHRYPIGAWTRRLQHTLQGALP